jgi:peptidylprolyl isomerase
MPTAKRGDTVRVHYTGRLSDGTIFDKTNSSEPLEFTIGAQEVLPKFEEAVLNLEVGRKRVVEIESGEAYGDWDENQVFEIDPADLPDDLEPEIGLDVEVKLPSGRSEVMTIVEIEQDAIVLDANHPLAGEDLIFEVRLVEIVKQNDT